MYLIASEDHSDKEDFVLPWSAPNIVSSRVCTETSSCFPLRNLKHEDALDG